MQQPNSAVSIPLGWIFKEMKKKKRGGEVREGRRERGGEREGERKGGGDERPQSLNDSFNIVCDKAQSLLRSGE